MTGMGVTDPQLQLEMLVDELQAREAKLRAELTAGGYRLSYSAKDALRRLKYAGDTARRHLGRRVPADHDDFDQGVELVPGTN